MSGELDENGQPAARWLYADRVYERDVDELLGVCRGVACDGVVSIAEARYLAEWLTRRAEVALSWPGSVIVRNLHAALVDGSLDEDEQAHLLEVLREVTGGWSFAPEVPLADRAPTTLPLTDPPPELVFDGRRFCLTGTFVCGTRNWCEEAIQRRGGITQSSPSRKTSYLVIGSVGSDAWKHSSFGTKILKAADLHDKGAPIGIVGEEHWAAALERTPLRLAAG